MPETKDETLELLKRQEERDIARDEAKVTQNKAGAIAFLIVVPVMIYFIFFAYGGVGRKIFAWVFSGSSE